MTQEAPRRILLDPANPFDFSESALRLIGDEIVALIPEKVEVTSAAREEYGYGGPLSEVLHVWLDVAETVDALAFAGYVATACGQVLKRRWDADHESCGEGEKPRKRVATIYGPDDRALLEVEVDGPQGAIVERQPKGSDGLAHPRPSGSNRRP